MWIREDRSEICDDLRPIGHRKKSAGRELGKRNDWHIFPQHLAFDIACAVVGLVITALRNINVGFV